MAAADGGFRSGFVSIVGRPNCGKSTLINKLVESPVAIVATKPQTTRGLIRAVARRPGLQIVFLDTPGIHKPRDPLGSGLNRTARMALEDVDAVLVMVDVAAGIGRGDRFVVDAVRGVQAPTLLLCNKIDRLSPEQLDVQLGVAGDLGAFLDTVPVSATEGTNLDKLVDLLATLMPPGPKYYPDDMITDQPLAVMASEIIRERLIDATEQELPYSIAVVVEEMTEEPGADLVTIEAKVLVERDSQKGMVIGAGGRLLKKVGMEARTRLEALLGKKVYLETRVSVRKDWRKDTGFVERLYGQG